MSDTSPQGNSPDKLSIVVYSGVFDRVHYALVMASAAAAIGRPATLFFTMGACRALLSDAGRPGWHDLPTDLPSDGGAAGLDRAFGERGVARFEELLSACAALGVRVIVCEMGLRAVDAEASSLRADIPIEVAGVVTLLADASKDGAVLFV